MERDLKVFKSSRSLMFLTVLAFLSVFSISGSAQALKGRERFEGTWITNRRLSRVTATPGTASAPIGSTVFADELRWTFRDNQIKLSLTFGDGNTQSNVELILNADGKGEENRSLLDDQKTESVTRSKTVWNGDTLVRKIFNRSGENNERETFSISKDGKKLYVDSTLTMYFGQDFIRYVYSYVFDRKS
jgi:hypothetical protein